MNTSTTQNYRAQAENVADRAAQSINEAANAAGSAVRDATRTVSAAASEIGDRATHATQDLSRRVEEQPLTSLLIAAGAGFLVGLVLGRR